MPDDPPPIRRPGDVPDDGPDVTGPDGVDTDGDGRPDTLLSMDGADLLVATDLDGDGLADRLLCLGPDGSVGVTAYPDPALPAGGPGHTPASWVALVGRLLGLGPDDRPGGD